MKSTKCYVKGKLMRLSYGWTNRFRPQLPPATGFTTFWHKGRHGGRHWRYFYKLYKEGKLEAEYDRVIGKKNYDVLYNNGFIYKDTTIQNIYKQINKE